MLIPVTLPERKDTAVKPFWGPHTCAIGAHTLLEEAGKPYELEELDVAGGETQKQPFKGVNFKGQGSDAGRETTDGPDRVRRHCDLARTNQSGQTPSAAGSERRSACQSTRRGSDAFSN
jgi:hypothetical protein